MWVVAVSDSDGFPAEALGPFGDPHEAAEAARQALAVIHARHSRFAGTEDAYLLELNQPPCPRDWHPGPPEFEALTGRTSKNIRRSASGCGSDGTDADASRRDCLDPNCRDRPRPETRRHRLARRRSRPSNAHQWRYRAKRNSRPECSFAWKSRSARSLTAVEDLSRPGWAPAPSF